ncbi:uncharacterized protein LOC113910434 [Zalophus californianus]|uniref:Uncharacterized protein LOC113910434 n=1 Tax=Zalophus californianus TaxID=9704 RepID=A0A6P9FKV5_ZALCA|nr:uncharacterized protein LOC113910434 [Zalophus californianus]XP_035584093.1 uncharacterized protein LOC113910434 [Zalophus californianus]XP_035584094.1 uncharacterized protein LOC113910434 [Zalophus californianus]
MSLIRSHSSSSKSPLTPEMSGPHTINSTRQVGLNAVGWTNGTTFSLYFFCPCPQLYAPQRGGVDRKRHTMILQRLKLAICFRGSLPLQHPALLWRALLQRRRDGRHIGLRANTTLAQSEACLISMPTNISRMSQSMKKSILDLVSVTLLLCLVLMRDDRIPQKEKHLLPGGGRPRVTEMPKAKLQQNTLNACYMPGTRHVEQSTEPVFVSLTK